METRRVKRKCLSEMEPSKERKSFKFSIKLSPNQALEPCNSGDEERLCKTKRDSEIKYDGEEKKLERGITTGKNISPQSKSGSAYPIRDKAPQKQFTWIGNSAGSNVMERKEQENCLAPSPNLEARAGFQVNIRQDPSSCSREQHLLEILAQESDESLKTRVAGLRQDNFMLSCQLQREATACMRLRDANTLIMDELRTILDPSVIEMLEARNPDNNPQINEETPSESSPE